MTQFTDNQAAPIGHNRPPLSPTEYIAALDLWTKTRRVADALSAEDIRRLEDGQRMATFARAKIEAMRKWLLAHPRENAELAVLEAIYFLADENGYCYAGQDRLARFFGRTRKNINDCIETLKKEGYITVESISGKPSHITPVIAPIFTITASRVWVLDTFAPEERAKPGRKPKRRGGIPVTDTVTPISKIPVTASVTPISKYLSPKTEIPVTASVTQISLDSPVVEEAAKHTGGATSNGFDWKEQAKVECSTSAELNGHAHARLAEGSQLQRVGIELARSSDLPLQGGVRVYNPTEIVYNTEGCEQQPYTSGDLLGGKLPSEQHLELWRRIVWRWGRSPEAKLKPLTKTLTKSDFSVGGWLKGDVKNLGYGKGHSPETILAALEITLSSMEACTLDEPTEAAKPGAKPAHNYFAKQFAGTLQRLRADEHAERIEAQKRQALAEIEIEGARTANGKKLAALDSRIQLGNDAAAKRIAATDANGKAAAPASKEDGNKSGFKEWEPIREMPCGFKIKGSHAQNIQEALPGWTTDSRKIRNAIDELKPPVCRYGPMSVTAEWVQTMVIEKLTGGDDPRPNIVSELVKTAECYTPEDGWVRDAGIDETAERIGATELEVFFVKEAQVVRNKRRGSNYHNGHYNGETL